MRQRRVSVQRPVARRSPGGRFLVDHQGLLQVMVHIMVNQCMVRVLYQMKGQFVEIGWNIVAKLCPRSLAT